MAFFLLFLFYIVIISDGATG